MRTVFLGGVDDVTNDAPTVAGPGDDIDVEAISNLREFSISEEVAISTPPEVVISFLLSVIAARERKLVELYGLAHAMVFYCWFDEQACQLRFSLVSKFHGSLPFRCKLRYVQDLSVIVRRFLDSPDHSGILWDELETAAPDSTILHSSGAGQPDYVLDIWIVELPRTGALPRIR